MPQIKLTSTMIWSHLSWIYARLIVNKVASVGGASLLNKSPSLATALGATRFLTIIANNLVALCCATKV